MKYLFFTISFLSVFSISCQTQTPKEEVSSNIGEQWNEQLTPDEYHIIREKGTEPAFSGKYWNHKEAGTYHCKVCNQPLFSSETKFKSGTGWPSFFESLQNNVSEIPDDSFGWNRTEIICSQCKGHLGHVFNDGPQPTGLRYCVNSASLSFESEK